MAENEPTQNDTEETEGAEVEGHVLDSQDLGPQASEASGGACVSLVSVVNAE